MSNQFKELSLQERMTLEGGIDWNLVGGTVSTASGAYIGAQVGTTVGTAGGPVGMVVGGIVGGAAGAIVYSLWD